ncbi:cadherin-related family member 5-like [Platysternon megacephalum]|uniref:Cadherin-related family member 5-like n=1 Tax=Platysternon megacephalum TaxID=55544 RepID=A0A4D9DT30_9SAUR|nr:cadherin-related family member 5-like [Platysternon megacephalum]
MVRHAMVLCALPPTRRPPPHQRAPRHGAVCPPPHQRAPRHGAVCPPPTRGHHATVPCALPTTKRAPRHGAVCPPPHQRAPCHGAMCPSPTRGRHATVPCALPPPEGTTVPCAAPRGHHARGHLVWAVCPAPCELLPSAIKSLQQSPSPQDQAQPIDGAVAAAVLTALPRKRGRRAGWGSWFMAPQSICQGLINL